MHTEKLCQNVMYILDWTGYGEINVLVALWPWDKKRLNSRVGIPLYTQQAYVFSERQVRELHIHGCRAEALAGSDFEETLTVHKACQHWTTWSLTMTLIDNIRGILSVRKARMMSQLLAAPHKSNRYAGYLLQKTLT